MSTIKCRCCGKDSGYKTERCVSVSDFKEKNKGWEVILTYDGGLYYVCPECFKKLQSYAFRIVNMINDENIYLGGIIRKKK